MRRHEDEDEAGVSGEESSAGEEEEEEEEVGAEEGDPSARARTAGGGVHRASEGGASGGEEAAPGEDDATRLREGLVDLRRRVTYDAMAVLFRRYELAKPSMQLLFERKWLTTFVSEPVYMYKVVATTLSGKLLSIYDGKTEYRLGRRQRARRGAASWPPITCCFFCYPSVHQAIAASLPAASRLRGQPRVILKLRCEGRAYVHNNRHATSGGRNVQAYERGDHEPVSVVVNGDTEYRSDAFDAWAFSDVVPVNIFRDIIQEPDGARRAPARDGKRMAFRV